MVTTNSTILTDSLISEELEEILNSFEGKDVNYYQGGQSGGYLCLESFYWSSNETIDGELLFLETDLENMHKFINMDCVEGWTYDPLKNEVRFVMENGDIISLICNEVE